MHCVDQMNFRTAVRYALTTGLVGIALAYLYSTLEETYVSWQWARAHYCVKHPGTQFPSYALVGSLPPWQRRALLSGHSVDV
jgi:hypothetical protein